jgi:hypothetical protein
MEQSTIKLLKYICICIIILILLRFIYLTVNEDDNNNVEPFVIDNNNAIDLLSTKLKSTAALQYLKTGTSELAIHPWNNKILNIQNTTLQKVKSIALYKPNLSINSVQYCKLGDMVSQDVNYNLPSPTEFTLLIKKTGSDIKPPTDYSLIVDSGDKNMNPDFYKYATFFNDISNLNNISTSLSNCSTTLTQLALLVKNNSSLILNELKNNIYKTAYLTVYDQTKVISQLNNLITINIWNDWSLTLPAGIIANIIDKDNSDIPVDISISKNLDTITSGFADVANALPFAPYGKIKSDKISRQYFTVNIFSNISKQTVVDYIKNLCLDIKNIYDTKNTELVTYLKLVDNDSTITTILSTIDSITDIKNFDLNSFAYIVGTNTSTLLGNIIFMILNSTYTYGLTFVNFTPDQINIGNPGVLNMLSFDNDIISNIPSDALDLVVNPTSSAQIKLIITGIFPNINNLLKFSKNLSNQSIPEFPLQIYNPLPPDGYLSLGHIFCNIVSDLDKIKAAQNIACVPSNCVKEIRDWVASDKIYEYNKNGIYWAIYFNPYTGTFISTNTPQLPLGKVSKVVACVAKCTAVDDLKKADDCARKYYNINKKAVSSTPVIPNLVSDQEEEFYLSKIKVQSDSIAKLGQRAQQMQLGIDKATIINKEMNKNKLQSYVDTQKINIDIIMKKLIDDKNKIHTNINTPLQKLIDLIKGFRLSPEVTNELIKHVYNKLGTGDANTNKVLSSCPKYDLTGLVKKSMVSDVCYGCDVPP